MDASPSKDGLGAGCVVGGVFGAVGVLGCSAPTWSLELLSRPLAVTLQP